MMYEDGKSDGPVVPTKSPNKAARGAAEVMEGRGSAKGNVNQQSMSRTQSRTNGMSQALGRVREAARRNKKMRFTALFHHVTIERLRTSFKALKRQASAGVDGVTWGQYEQNLETNLQALLSRLHSGAYRAQPSRRVFIPKADGGKRPLGIATLEDKLVQRAIVEVMNAIYEEDFLGFSYGFRPGRSQHDALDALSVGIHRKKVSWVLDTDIRGFFDAIDHGWLEKFVGHRIADRRIQRLVAKWLRAGVLEDGKKIVQVVGSPQGATVSPLLANIYLHYVFDLWVERWRRRHARGEVLVVRYADDIIVGFQHREDACRFHEELRQRMAKFGLELHPDKTRLISFGRYALERQAERGLGKPETFNFLGFTHICGQMRNGRFEVHRRTIKSRMVETLKAVRRRLLAMRHRPIPEQGAWLNRFLRGYMSYFAVWTNLRRLSGLREELIKSWMRSLKRRGQRHRMNWLRMRELVQRWLPEVRALHPWPEKRFDAKHLRQEPSAVVPLAGICAGGGP